MWCHITPKNLDAGNLGSDHTLQLDGRIIYLDLNLAVWVQSVFTHEDSLYANLLEQKKAFA